MPKTSAARGIRKLPLLLGCSTSKLKLMVEEIGKLGVRNKKLGQVIHKSPQVLLQKPQEFNQVGMLLYSPLLRRIQYHWHSVNAIFLLRFYRQFCF